MPDDSPLVRQWIVLRLLSSHRYGLTLRDLAKELGVTARSVRNILEVLQGAGFPLEETLERHGRKRWRIELNSAGGLPVFTLDEAIALHLSRRFLDPLAGTLFWDAAQRGFGKIREMLSRSVREYTERWAGLFHPTTAGLHDYSVKSDILDQLMQAIEDRRIISLTYRSQSSAEAKTYEVHPYGLVYHRASLYMVGLSAPRDEIRHWKVERMGAAELTEKQFRRPVNFDLQTHLAASFGVYRGEGNLVVRVRFSPIVARYVQEATWHPSQRLTATEDGGVVAEFRLSHTEEIKHWVLSFGNQAEVLSPRRLRQEIAQELKGLLQQYEGDFAESVAP